MTSTNKHGVAGRDAYRGQFIPVCCEWCKHFLPPQDDTWQGPGDYAGCALCRFLPTRKGTCSRREARGGAP